MLRKIRIALAAFFFVGITLLFVGIGHDWWGWMAKLQFLPSALALNLVVVGIILLAVFLFGRVYCSTICPLGVFQDVIIWIRRTIGKWQRNRGVRKLQQMKERGEKPGPEAKNLIKHFEHKYHPERRWVRYNVLALSLVSLFVSGQMLIALIAPYSAYGRVVRSIVGLANGSITLPLLITGLVTLVVIGCCAWLWGREYCNTVCPVGTTLGLVSRFALFRPTIDTTKCTQCGRCERGCKASCIDYKKGKIEHLPMNLLWITELQMTAAALREGKKVDLDKLKLNLFADKIFVYTPKGDIVDLPKGSLPLDFAYRLHSEIGDHVVGVKINGKISNLNKQLENFDIVEILTSKNQTPKSSWLSKIFTPHARSKLMRRLNQEGETVLPEKRKKK